MTKEEMELFEEECWTDENDSKIWDYWDKNVDVIESYKENGVHPDITYEEFRDSALHFIAIGRLMERELMSKK